MSTRSKHPSAVPFTASFPCFTITHPGCSCSLQEAREAVSFWALVIPQTQQLMCITQSKHCTLCLQAQRLQLSHWPPSTALQPCWNTAGPKLYLTVWNSSTGLFFSCLTSASPLFTVNLSASETPKALYHIKQSCLQNSSWCYEFWSAKED